MCNPVRCCRGVKCFFVLLLPMSMFASGFAKAQPPTLDAIEVLPLGPISALDWVEVEARGTVNVSGFPTFQSFWQRNGAEILVDLLDVELPTLAPPVFEPYSETVEIGTLPAGNYDLTVRLFYVFEGEDPIPNPWDFPDTFGLAFDAGDPGPLTLNTSFVVVPEPSSLALIAAFMVTSVGISQRRRFVRYSSANG